MVINFNVLIRTTLIAIATTCNILIVSYSDRLPYWVPPILIGIVTAIAGAGIIPPQVPAILATKREIVASEPGQTDLTRGMDT